MDALRAAWTSRRAGIDFVPQKFVDHDGRQGALLDRRALPPQAHASEAAWIEAVAKSATGPGLSFRICSRTNAKYLLNLVQGAGYDAALFEKFKSGDPHATSVVRYLVVGAFRIEEFENTVLVPTVHSGKTNATEGDLVFDTFKAVATSLDDVGFDANIISRDVIEKGPVNDVKAREAHYAAGEVHVNIRELQKHVGKTLCITDDDVFSGATLAAIVTALERAIKEHRLDIKLMTLVVARFVHAARSRHTFTELALVVREKVRAASRRLLQSLGLVRSKAGVDVALT